MDLKQYIESGLLEAYALGSLSPKERLEVEAMLEAHPELVAELEVIENGLESIAQSLSIAPPESLKGDLFDKLEEKETISVAFEPMTVSTLDNSKSINIWKYAAAASIVLAVTSGYFALDFRSKWKETNQAYLSLQSTNTLMADQYNQVNNRLDELEQDVSIITNPAFKSITMAAVNESDTFTANIYWNQSSQEVFLKILDLKELATDQQYQLWAIVEGKPVDLGVFDVDSTLLKMKDIDNPELFAVTIEPRGGSVNPTLDLMQVAGSVG